MAQTSRLQLLKRYHDESQVILQELATHLETLGQTPWAAEPLQAILRIFHNLAGSGTLYGAPHISALGGEGEYLCTSCSMAGRALNEEEVRQLEGLVRRIRSEFQSLFAAAAQAPSLPARQDGIPILYLASPPSPARDALADYFSKRRIEVVTLASIREAERRLDAALPDMAAVNVRLPDGPGYDLVRHIRSLETEPSIPILLVGEDLAFMDKVEAIHCGADGFAPNIDDAATLLKKFKSLTSIRKTYAGRILAVEDDPAQSAFLRECLKGAGYEVHICSNPSLFESDLYSFRPDLVIMDILLPGASGYDLVRFMRQEEGFAAIPVVFLTVQGQRRSQILATDAGGDDFLAKPVTPSDLLLVIRSRLARFRSLQDLMDRDELTGFLAHTPFLREARLCLSRHSRRKNIYAMVLLQADGLQDLNARYGPRAEGSVIQGLGRFLHRKIRQTDVMGRYGQDQLAIVLEHLSSLEALRLIRRIQQEFSTLVHPLGEGRSVRATFSAGVAMVNPNLKTLKDWLDQAGDALHDAVRRGGNQTALHGGEAIEPPAPQG